MRRHKSGESKKYKPKRKIYKKALIHSILFGLVLIKFPVKILDKITEISHLNFEAKFQKPHKNLLCHFITIM